MAFAVNTLYKEEVIIKLLLLNVSFEFILFYIII